MRNEEVLQSKDRNILHTIEEKEVGTTFQKMLVLKGRHNVREDKEDDIGSYYMTLRRTRDAGESRSHCMENSLWRRLWTCRKRDYTITGALME